MLKGRGRASAGVAVPPPGHLGMRSAGVTSAGPGQMTVHPGLARTGQVGQLQQRALPAKPEPDYEVVEFPSDQYVNAKLQPPPPPPPRPPTGHPAQAGASCGLCGGGGARVRCAECGRRALCASCDDMYHRHPKRRHHQRQALSLSQLGEDRPPLPPKGTPPVPPPRRHKMSASPMPPLQTTQDQRRTNLTHTHTPVTGMRASASPTMNQSHQPILLQTKIVSNPSQLGSMPFLPTTMPHQHAVPMHMQQNANTLGNLNARWSGPRGSLQGFNVPQVQEPWDNSEAIPTSQWGRPMRRGASTLELGGGAACAGCVQCAPPTWRYGSCATLDQSWNGGWPIPPQCCPPQQPAHGHFHMHQHQPMTPQPYRRADSRVMSRAVSRAGSRAASPSLSVRSRASRRTKHRSPSPPLPSSDADSESESESETAPKPQHRVARSNSRSEHPNSRPERPSSRTEQPSSRNERPSSRNERRSSRNEHPSSINERPNSRSDVEDGLGPVPPPPAAPWQCEHCTYVNEAGVRVCVICCRTPTAAPKVVAEVASNFEQLNISRRPASSSPEKVEPIRVEQVSERTNTNLKKERTSTGCGPSPPREEKVFKKTTQRLVTPTREQNGSSTERPHSRHDMAVGPSPPKETRSIHKNESPRRELSRASPYDTKKAETPQHHSISVGPSPPRDKTRQESNVTGQKKSAGTSPPRDVRLESRSSSITGKTNVSNTGTSPPPQSISTQTYEDPSTYERERAPSVARSRPRRRFRDDRRERSRSRHSLSSDTRESERSVRTTGAWEWRERDGSPITGGEWGGKLARRASHLDLRRRDVKPRRTSLYGSEAPSPEPPGSGRAISMEVLSGAGRNAERGLELARLLAEAERLGYSAAEVQVGLAQSPGAPLAWLRSRWAGLVGAVQGAAARLAPAAPLSEPEARAALARHRGAVWPAVTECVDTLRRQTVGGGGGGVSAAGLVRGRVWGSPAGADDEAAPRAREDSSDEYDTLLPENYWYPSIEDGYDLDPSPELWSLPPPAPPVPPVHDDVASKLRSLLLQAGIASVDENLLLRGLFADAQTKLAPEPIALGKLDLIQSENDFIDAYNALTRASPLPSIGKPNNDTENEIINTESAAKEQYIKNNDETQRPSVREISKHNNKSSHHHLKHKNHVQKQSIQENLNRENNQPEIKIVSENKQSQSSPSNNDTNVPDKIAQIISRAVSREIQNFQIEENQINQSNRIPIPSPAQKASASQKNERNTLTEPLKVQNIRQADDKTSNLNEIVDNTQKLIQQMKEEINSDIHSLDDGHSQSSLSDHDTSSHDEQESSYSESEEESNHTTVTSDEKEITSSSSEEDLNDDNNNDTLKSKSSSAFINRTSSEDNEQFEEALDNLDNQIEDVKHANIEMLDSIARSLQEEHTISVELHEPKGYIDQNISIVINKPEVNNLKSEDSNNNIFVAVNSFEEIYEELNTSKVNKIPSASVNNNDNNTTTKSIDSLPGPHKSTFTKFVINESVFKAVSPTKILVLENTEPIYNAVIEDVEILIENSLIETATAVIHDDTAEESINKTININFHETFDSEPVNDLNLKSSSVKEITEPAMNSNSNVDITKSNSTSITTGQNTNLASDEQQSNDMKTQNVSVNKNGFIKQNTPEKTTSNLTIDVNSNKSPTASKSSIPKPIRQASNNKPKNDKQTPKLLVSKVPVRRGSTKQNHAPTSPKSHFGNVQNGHVKQLQSKIFNTKPVKPQVTEIEAKPSTSTATFTKKGPAPQPPRKLDQKQPTPPKTSPPREKRDNYFRETCRTEDEWTESDSDESQILKQTFNEEVPPSPPSPPPPITVRRVSGNIIDLARVRLPDGSPERQARMLLAEGATETWEQAHLAVELVSRGADLPAALLAALECADLPAALTYLHQDCELCASRLPEHEMVSMLRCTHRCCRECARLYFTVQITERSIADCVCPFCKMPELETLPEDAWLEYFSHLDIQLKMLLETDVHELFQRKLRDRTLAMDPNFRWCMECSSGFFVHPKHKKLRCPECRSVSCASCRKPWTSNHEGLSCEQYTAWLADNDPEISVAAVQQHLRENGLECPRCHFKYSLSRGGCMHFTCTQCKYEFCYGCGKPFTMGARCGLSEYCAKLGLHAHHPRNCLFYLRDKEPHELQTLLQMNNVTYETEAAEGTNGRCPIPLQRETPAGLVDGICGSEAPPKHAGLCKNHYLEYLTRQVRARGADPLPILGVDDLETLVRRAGLRPPPRPYGSLEGLYRRALTEIVREKIPLD